MITKKVITVIFLPVIFLYTLSANADTLCKKNEVNYFTCNIATTEKAVSLCGSNYWDKGKSELTSEPWLQYRFGKPKYIEQEFPKEKKDSLAKFVTVHRQSKNAALHSISIMENGSNYSIDMIDTEITNSSTLTITYWQGGDIVLPCYFKPLTPEVVSGKDIYNFIEELAVKDTVN